MRLLVKRCSFVNVHPYYVYVHDLVQGTEELRTTVQTAIDLEKHLRGSTAGFNTPTFVVDAPGGGGKRDVHSFEHYDRTTGDQRLYRTVGQTRAILLLFRSYRPAVQRRAGTMGRSGRARRDDQRGAGCRRRPRRSDSVERPTVIPLLAWSEPERPGSAGPGEYKGTSPGSSRGGS